MGQAVHVNGAGITYAALEAKTAQKVEVREFYPHTIAVRGETGASVLPVSGAELKFSDYLSEFERYAQKLLRVSDTKHIQHAIDTFSQNNTQYIVFSFTESVSLRQYVEEHGVLSWTQCEQFFTRSFTRSAPFMRRTSSTSVSRRIHCASQKTIK